MPFSGFAQRLQSQTAQRERESREKGLEDSALESAGGRIGCFTLSDTFKPEIGSLPDLTRACPDSPLCRQDEPREVCLIA
jgi:hypothetical protein